MLTKEKQAHVKALEKFHWTAMDVIGKYYKGMITYAETVQYLMKKATAGKYSQTLCCYLADILQGNCTQDKMIEIASKHIDNIISYT